MVSGKVGIILIGIGIIAVVLLTPRKVISPEKVSGFVGSFSLVSPKPTVQTVETVQVAGLQVTAKPEQIAGGDISTIIGIRDPIQPRPEIGITEIIKTEPTLEPAKAFTRLEPTFQNLAQAFGSPEFDPLLERSEFTFSEFFERFRIGVQI